MIDKINELLNIDVRKFSTYELLGYIKEHWNNLEELYYKKKYVNKYCIQFKKLAISNEKEVEQFVKTNKDNMTYNELFEEVCRIAEFGLLWKSWPSGKEYYSNVFKYNKDTKEATQIASIREIEK